MTCKASSQPGGPKGAVGYMYIYIYIYIRRPLVGHQAEEVVFSHKSLSKSTVTGHQSSVASVYQFSGIGTCLIATGTAQESHFTLNFG